MYVLERGWSFVFCVTFNIKSRLSWKFHWSSSSCSEDKEIFSFNVNTSISRLFWHFFVKRNKWGHITDGATYVISQRSFIYLFKPSFVREMDKIHNFAVFSFCQYLFHSIVNVDLKISEKNFRVFQGFWVFNLALSWGESILQNGWIILSPLLYFNSKSFKDPNSSSVFRFQSIQHDSGVVSQVFKISTN